LHGDNVEGGGIKTKLQTEEQIRIIGGDNPLAGVTLCGKIYTSYGSKKKG
jgi:hypothetical protein